MLKNLLIRWGILAEPSIAKATAGVGKVLKKLEDTVEFHKAKQYAAEALAAAKAEEARVAGLVHQDTAVVLGNFKKLLNIKD